MKHFLKMLAFGVMAFAFSSTGELSAQVETGQLAGTVTDPSSAVISGATVKIKNIGTNAERNETTSGDGTYRVTGLQPATYEVTIQSASFQPYTGKVQITVGGHATLDAKLSLSSSTTQVEVVGEGGSQVNTQSQELSQIINEEQVSQLPSLTRNPYDSSPCQATSRPVIALRAVTRDPTILIRMVQARREVSVSVSMVSERAALKYCLTAWKTYPSSVTVSVCMCRSMQCRNFV